MPLRLVFVVMALLLAAPAGALASVADEERQGGELVAQLRAGDKRCDDLAAQDFERIGEYVMGRMVGSTRTHEAMNERMRQMMGERAEQRMHELMGRRYAGCATGAGAAGTPMGPGMMGGDWGSGMMGDGWGPMMDSEDWSWMAGGAWRTMDRQDWQAMQNRWMGPGMMRAGSGWSAWEIVGVVLAGLLAAALLAVLLTRRPWRHRPVSAAP
jgi:hypothetical protein